MHSGVTAVLHKAINKDLTDFKGFKIADQFAMMGYLPLVE